MAKIIAEKNQYIEDLKKYNGDLTIDNFKLPEEVDRGKFFESERHITTNAMQMCCELLHINTELRYQNEELKIHIRSLLYEGKQYDNIDG